MVLAIFEINFAVYNDIRLDSLIVRRLTLNLTICALYATCNVQLRNSVLNLLNFSGEIELLGKNNVTTFVKSFVDY